MCGTPHAVRCCRWRGEGNFKDVLRNCVYEGKWEDGDGVGTIYGEGGEMYHGSWKNGVPFTGKGSWRSRRVGDNSRKILEGEWDSAEGAGLIVGVARGEKFAGAWADGDGAPVTGKGRWFSEEGFNNMYIGEWKDTRGSGKIKGAEGQKFSGDWWGLMPYAGKGMFRGPDGFDFQGTWRTGTREWRGRKWKDQEVGPKTNFVLRRSKFMAGRATPAERAQQAAEAAGALIGGAQRKAAGEAAAQKLLGDDGESARPGSADKLPSDRPSSTQADAEMKITPEQQKKLDALQTALDCGALNEGDFNRARRRILGLRSSSNRQSSFKSNRSSNVSFKSNGSSDHEPTADELRTLGMNPSFKPGVSKLRPKSASSAASYSGSDPSSSSDAESEDSEERDASRLKAASMRSRRTANPWTQDAEYCPPSIAPAMEDEADDYEPTEEELRYAVRTS